MATFLICHGAWGGGHSWRKVRPLLRAAGHEVFTPTYTGLGERAHLAHPLIGLDTHVEDILAVIAYEDLDGLVLVGHSYGGMVATGVADRVPQRVRHLIYLDAFVPESGRSLADYAREHAEPVDGWLIPPRPPSPDTAQADIDWNATRRRHQSARCFTQKLHLTHHAAPPFPRSFIHCTKKEGHDTFRHFADRVRADPAWRLHEMAESHSPNTTAPDALASLLLRIAAG